MRTRLKDLLNVRGDIAKTLCGISDDLPCSGDGRFDYCVDGTEWVQIVQFLSLCLRAQFLVSGNLCVYFCF
jgi:hypothetical protein